MESDKLYRVEEKDLPKLQNLLNQCFACDPLYQELIPDEQVRKRLMPELFSCDLTEFYETCEIFADSPDLRGVLVVSDETEPYNLLKYYFSEVMASLRTDGYLIREDPSLKTFFNFFVGRDYLNSSWTDQLHQARRIHIIYLAVDPAAQDAGGQDIQGQGHHGHDEGHGAQAICQTHKRSSLNWFSGRRHPQNPAAAAQRQYYTIDALSRQSQGAG